MSDQIEVNQPHRADAHIHLFEGGFRGESLNQHLHVHLEEATAYSLLMKSFDVEAALVIGYAGEVWCETNNTFLADKVRDHTWVRPTAYVDLAEWPTVEKLEGWKKQGFVGISMYVFDDQAVAALRCTPAAVWDWLIQRRWLISVNSRGSHWSAWSAILEKHAELRLLISHLGLPPKLNQPQKATELRRALANVLTLGQFPGPRVKLSGFYAATEPGYDYPHQAVWPYVEVLLEEYGPGRLLWGSDFAPSLKWLSFPQTFGIFSKMPFIEDGQRRQIEGGNLLSLLDQVSAR